MRQDDLINIPSVWFKNGKQFVMEKSIERTVDHCKVPKIGYELKKTPLICVTHRLMRADLNSKQLFYNWVFKIIQSPATVTHQK